MSPPRFLFIYLLICILIFGMSNNHLVISFSQLEKLNTKLEESMDDYHPHLLGSKNTRMAPKTHTTYVRISTQRMDTLHTIRWRGGDSTKNQCGKNSSIQRSSSAVAYVFGITIRRTPFLNRLFCIEIFIFETSTHP